MAGQGAGIDVGAAQSTYRTPYGTGSRRTASTRRASGMTALRQRFGDLRPAHAPVLGDVPSRDRIRDPLKAQRLDQPIKQRRRVMVPDGANDAMRRAGPREYRQDTMPTRQGSTWRAPSARRTRDWDWYVRVRRPWCCPQTVVHRIRCEPDFKAPPALRERSFVSGSPSKRRRLRSARRACAGHRYRRRYTAGLFGSTDARLAVERRAMTRRLRGRGGPLG